MTLSSSRSRGTCSTEARTHTTSSSSVCDVTDKESSNNVKDRMGEIDKHVSDGVNKLLTEDKCYLTTQEELSKDEANELADSLNVKRAIRERGN